MRFNVVSFGSVTTLLAFAMENLTINWHACGKVLVSPDLHIFPIWAWQLCIPGLCLVTHISDCNYTLFLFRAIFIFLYQRIFGQFTSSCFILCTYQCFAPRGACHFWEWKCQFFPWTISVHHRSNFPEIAHKPL